MGSIRVLESGELDLSSVEELSRKELSQWIEVRLTGRDIDMPADPRQDETPHSLIVDIYPGLKRSVREEIQYILLDFLKEFAAGQSPTWQGDAADELLMLAMRLDADDTIDFLLEAVESQRFYPESLPEEDVDLHRRLLQALLTFEYRGSPQFWEAQARLSLHRFGAVCFDGLAQTSPESAFELLPELSWSNEFQRRILLCLPGLIDDHTLDYIGRLFLRVSPRLCASARTAIGSFLQEEGWTRPVGTGEAPSIKQRLAAECSLELDALLEHYGDSIKVTNHFALFQEYLRGLWDMRHSREEEFAELLLLIESVTKHADPEQFTTEQIDVSKKAVTKLDEFRISRMDLAACRASFRSCGLDIYRPLDNLHRVPKFRLFAVKVEEPDNGDESALS